MSLSTHQVSLNTHQIDQRIVVIPALSSSAPWRRAPVPPPPPAVALKPRQPAANDDEPTPGKVVGAIRRSLPRHDVELDVDFDMLGKTYRSTTRMLSLGGAFIASALVPAFGTRLELRLALPTMDWIVEVGGVVRWADARGFGVQFDGLRARDVWAMGKYFEARRRAAAAAE
jgi:hypothetical protein